MRQVARLVVLVGVGLLLVASQAVGQPPGLVGGESSVGALARVVRGMGRAHAVEGEAACYAGREPLPQPPEGVALVEIMLGRGQLCIAARLNDRARTVRMPIAEPDLRDVASTWLKKIQRGKVKRKLGVMDHLLLEPIADLLAEARVAAFIPAGILHEVPFGALRMVPDRFLVEELPIAVVPSRDLLAMRSNAADGLTFHNILVMSNPVLESLPDLRWASREYSIINRLYDESLLQLREARERSEGTSMESLSHVGRVTVGLAGSWATIDNLKKAIRGKQVAHLAVHGYDDGEFPALAMGSPSSDARPNVFAGSREHRINPTFPWELSCLELATVQLVVLSGCETAVFSQGDLPNRLEQLVYYQQLQPKEEDEEVTVVETPVTRPVDSRFTRSLAAPFLFRGVPFVLGTLYAIADAQETVQLVADFHQHLAKGFGPVAALRCAQQAATATLPMNAVWRWAAFSLLTGDLNALVALDITSPCLPSVEVTLQEPRSQGIANVTGLDGWYYEGLRQADAWPEIEEAVVALDVPKVEWERLWKVRLGCLSDAICVQELSDTQLIGFLFELVPETLHEIYARHSKSVSPPREAATDDVAASDIISGRDRN